MSTLIRLYVIVFSLIGVSLFAGIKFTPTDAELINHINTETELCECDYECVEIFARDGNDFRATFKNRYSGFVYIMDLKFCYRDYNLKVKQR